MHKEQNRPHTTAVPLGFFRDGAPTGSEHGSAMLDTAELKIVALEHLARDLRNRFEGRQLAEDAPPPEYEWRELKDTVADVS